MRSQQLGEAVRLDKTRHDTATKIWLNATTHPPQRVAVWKYGAVCMVGWLVSNDKATAVSFWFSTDSKYRVSLKKRSFTRLASKPLHKALLVFKMVHNDEDQSKTL